MLVSTAREPVVNPPQQTIDEGSSARFQCYVPGDPSAQISWHRQDGAPLGADVSESNGMLTITNAQASDAGAYVCHAQQAHTTQPALSSPVYLNVNPQQSVHPVVDPPSQSVDEGSPARFRCYVPGNPSAQLSWRKEDGSALGYDVTDSQGMLSFSRASPSDAGAYICSFQDPHGGAPVQSSPAYLGINPRRPSNPVVEPPSQTVDDGDHAKFRCFLPGVPDAQITWRKMDGSQLGPDVSDNRGMLTFQRAQSSDAGAYICTAQDSRGGHPVDAPPAYLNTFGISAGTAPALMIDPSSQTVNENEPAQFKCWVPGVLACELTWHHEYIGGPLPYGVYQSGGILKIPRAQLHDAGNYICTASNQYGIGQSPPAHLTVNRPPQAPRVDPPEITVNDGDPARFRCWVPGDPSAKLEWHLRTGEPLPQGVQENEGILNFQSARQHHSNGYVCTATDPDGRNPPMQSSEVRLNVRKRMFPPDSLQEAFMPFVTQLPILHPFTTFSKNLAIGSNFAIDNQAKAPSVEPATLTVNEGDSIEIRCWSDEIEDAELHWRRADGDPLGYGISEARDGTLSTDKVRLADAGEYICSATDPQTEHTADSEPVQLNVGSETNERPEIDPPELIVNEGDPAQFRCFVHGNPHAQLRWSREGDEPLPHGVSANGDGQLYIPNSRHSDAGTYVCSQIDPHRGHQPIDSTSATLVVHAPRPRVEHPPAHGFEAALEVDPLEQTVAVGQAAQITCTVDGEASDHLKWHKLVEHHLPDHAQQSNGVLLIHNIQQADAGEYVCTYVDPHAHPDTPPGQGVTARINVEMPVIPIVDPHEQTVPENHPTRIRCWVPGNPAASLSWRKHDGTFPSEVEERDGMLHIPRTTPHDAGHYICSTHDPRTGSSVDSLPARVIVEQRM
ncbi:unnamed protein product [Anisakis simplex]|uniref:Ig-like domain-containing protein n=1 Tax=Anisakis simplex TaxID=6269 RepID=A0A3P6RAH4_ANISI|nr:unnamed protein product [Anisakis simplex]